MAVLGLRRRWVTVLLIGLIAAFQVADGAPWFWPPGGDDPGGCLSWRVMVEANNAKFWRAVPAPCVGYVWAYMSWGQYGRDVSSAADQIAAYASQTPAAGDGLDAWVLDIDDTCLSNLPYYQAKQFGAYDPAAFKAWASRGACPGIPAMVRLFWALKGGGFRVFLLSGRDEEALGASTAANLAAAGFAGYDRLILRAYDKVALDCSGEEAVTNFQPKAAASCVGDLGQDHRPGQCAVRGRGLPCVLLLGRAAPTLLVHKAWKIIWLRNSALTRASAWSSASSSMDRMCTRRLCRAGGHACECPASCACACRFGSFNLHLALHRCRAPVLELTTNIKVDRACAPSRQGCFHLLLLPSWTCKCITCQRASSSSSLPVPLAVSSPSCDRLSYDYVSDLKHDSDNKSRKAHSSVLVPHLHWLP